MGFLNNAWVIGIVTGILSGLLVTWLLNLFISKKKNREYQQQIANANREVIYSIRAGIPEDDIPVPEVIEALIHSTARRHSVDPSELYQPKELSEELIKEVMDSTFLSAAKKGQYCAALIPIGEKALTLAANIEDETASLSVEEFRIKQHAQRLKSTQFESLFAVFAGLLTAIGAGIAASTVAMGNLEEKLNVFKHSLFQSITIALSALLVIMFAFVASERILKSAWKKRQDNSNDNLS